MPRRASKKPVATKKPKKGKKDSPLGEEELLLALQSDLNIMFGDGTAGVLSDTTTLSRIDHWVSTGSVVVDTVLRGGRPYPASLVPFGRMMEISGDEASGKTTLAAMIAAQVQRGGGLVIVTDTEERIAHEYWALLGVDTSRIMHISAGNLKDVFNKQYRALEIARSYAGDRELLLIWDSLGGTRGSEHLDKDKVGRDGKPITVMDAAEKFGMRRAKVISDGFEVINTIITKTRACYLFTNHEYTRLDVKYGDAREQRGGRKPKYFSTVRIQLTRRGEITTGDKEHIDVIGQQIQVRTLKNSMSGILMYRNAVLMAGRGFVNDFTIFDEAKRLELIEIKGSWGTWMTPKGEEVKFQGYNGFVAKVIPHLEYADLYSAVEAAM